MQKISIEFSNRFDILYNNIMSNQAPGLNLYEKSIFLTKAQDEVVKNHANPKGNKYQEGADGSSKRRADLSMLTKVYTSQSVSGDSVDVRSEHVRFFSCPDDVLVVLNERVIETKENEKLIYVVVPVSYEELDRLMKKPYKLPLRSQVWRLVEQLNSEGELVVETVGNFNADYSASYTIKYVKKPEPIILCNLDKLYPNASIEGITEETPCVLSTELHEEIIQRAVELAKSAYAGNLESLTAMGQRSE